MTSFHFRRSEAADVLAPDSAEIRIAPGDALFIPTGDRFWVENTGPDDLVFLCHDSPPWPDHDEAIVWE